MSSINYSFNQDGGIITSAYSYNTVTVSAVVTAGNVYNMLFDYGDGIVETFYNNVITPLTTASPAITKNHTYELGNRYYTQISADNVYCNSAYFLVYPTSANEYYVNITSAYTDMGIEGSSEFPFNWFEFKDRVSTTGQGVYGDIYKLRGDRTLTKDLTATYPWTAFSIDKDKNYRIEDWDVSAYGPWIINVQDQTIGSSDRVNNSIVSFEGSTIKNGIIYNKPQKLNEITYYGGELKLTNTLDSYVVNQGLNSKLTLAPYINELSSVSAEYTVDTRGIIGAISAETFETGITTSSANTLTDAFFTSAMNTYWGSDLINSQNIVTNPIYSAYSATHGNVYTYVTTPKNGADTYINTIHWLTSANMSACNDFSIEMNFITSSDQSTFPSSIALFHASANNGQDASAINTSYYNTFHPEETYYDRTNYITIELDHTKIYTTSANYPLSIVLNKISATDFWDNIKIDGGDLIVSDEQRSRLPLDIDYIDKANKRGLIHFSTPNLLKTSADSTNDKFYIYYGNNATSAIQPVANSTYGRNSVWDSGYVGVWHFGEMTSGYNPVSGIFKDSTSNNGHSYNTTSAGFTLPKAVSNTLSANFIYGVPVDFPMNYVFPDIESWDYISGASIMIRSSSALQSMSATQRITIETFVNSYNETYGLYNPNILSKEQQFALGNVTDVAGYEPPSDFTTDSLDFFSSHGYLDNDMYYVAAQTVFTNNGFGGGIWEQLFQKNCFIYGYDYGSGKAISVYSQDTEGTIFTNTKTELGGSIVANNNILYIGSSYNNNSNNTMSFNGWVDEVRISNIERDNNWLMTSKNLILNNSACWGVSAISANVSIKNIDAISELFFINNSLNNTMNFKLDVAGDNVANSTNIAFSAYSPNSIKIERIGGVIDYQYKTGEGSWYSLGTTNTSDCIAPIVHIGNKTYVREIKMNSIEMNPYVSAHYNYSALPSSATFIYDNMINGSLNPYFNSDIKNRTNIVYDNGTSAFYGFMNLSDRFDECNAVWVNPSTSAIIGDFDIQISYFWKFSYTSYTPFVGIAIYNQSFNNGNTILDIVSSGTLVDFRTDNEKFSMNFLTDYGSIYCYDDFTTVDDYTVGLYSPFKEVGLRIKRENDSISGFYKDGINDWVVMTATKNYSENVALVFYGDRNTYYSNIKIVAESGFPYDTDDKVGYTSGTLETVDYDIESYYVNTACDIKGSTLYSENPLNTNSVTAFNLVLTDSVFTNLSGNTTITNINTNLSAYNNTIQSSELIVGESFNINESVDNQFGWVAPVNSEYPFHYSNSMYGMDYLDVFDNKQNLRPFNGITTPPNPGKGFPEYTDYTTGLFGYKRKNYGKTKLRDIDGNSYETVIIGNQEWTAENWKCTKLNDGTPIPEVILTATWSTTTDPAYCYYDNNSNNNSIYGKLYNYYAVGTGLLAPEGWHVPSDADWTKLENYLVANGYNYDGTTTGNKIAKSLSSKTSWASSPFTGSIGNDLTLNNRSGFNCYPGGWRGPGEVFGDMSIYGFLWCSTEINASYALLRKLYNRGIGIDSIQNFKNYGYSVRLVRD